MASKWSKGLAVASLIVLTLAHQPVLADGWRHHGRGHATSGAPWVPFALGAVVGGMAISATLQPQPIIVQPAYSQLPVYVRPRVIVPPPGYVLIQPPPMY